MFLVFTHYLPAQAQWVPTVSDDPTVMKVFDQDTFDFVSKTLSQNKLARHLNCTLKTRTSHELRKFSDGEKWIDVLEITYNTNGFDSGQKMNIKIPILAKVGIKKDLNQWSGMGEVIKIELGDYYSHWLRFTHDGQGHIVQLMMGSDLRMLPCQTD